MKRIIFSGIISSLILVTNLLGQTKRCRYVTGASDAGVLTALTQLGFTTDVATTIPSDLSSYILVICEDYGACNTTTADYIKNYVASGGGAILMGGTPCVFCGGGYDISYISSWFGTSRYSNVGVSYAKVEIDNPLRTSLRRNDILAYCGGWGGAAVRNVASDATILAMWDYDSGNIFSFVRSYQKGSVAFWAGSPSYNDKSKELFKAICWETAGNISHTVSTPNTPSGPSTGTVNQSLSFSTGGSTCNQGHSVQYRFYWGNGVYSSWGSSSQSYAYSSPGTYTVKAQARCSSDNSVVSSWSGGKSVRISAGGGDIPITPSTASTQQAGAEFDVEIIVGPAAKPVSNLYGVSFELGYSTTYIDYVSYDMSSSFLGSDLLEFVTPDDPHGKVAVGLTRKGLSTGVNSYGSVIKIRFKSLRSTPANTQISFAIQNTTANDPNGNPIGLAFGSATITITSGITVWPGDTNNDRIVNQADVLPLGVHWNKTGPRRTCHANETQWIGHTVSPWTPEAATYADGNGDGIVNQADVLVIGLNWGKTHTMAKTSDENEPSGVIAGTLIPKLSFNAERKEVYLDIQAESLADLFGLAFELNYPPQDLAFTLAEAGDLFSQDLIFFYKDDPGLGKMGIGISRKMGQKATAEKGSVARITFRLSTGERSLENAGVKIEGVKANDAQGKPIHIQAQACSNPVWTDIAAAPVTQYQLFTNYPNPFNPTTTISYALPAETHVCLHVFDLTGRLVRTLVDAVQQPSMHSVTWDARDDAGKEVANGMYIYRMTAGDHVLHQKMILAK
ncbi:MAG: cohesin domain-containing protein [bacterium]|jgi:hypothetical protein|nr:cohesin domain-containing protein [candidate division KSB1 bacterium]MDH7561411.1 cohesin domain-containing protein [bacterium]